MSVYRRDPNGRHERNEALREADIITPQKLAVLVAAEVGKLLGPYLQSAAHLLGQESKPYIEAVNRDAAREINASFQRVCTDWSNHVYRIEKAMMGMMQLFEKERDNFWQRVKEAVAFVDRKADQASVKTLTAIIGKEIEQMELEAMIRDEVRAAVRDALRALGKPTGDKS